MSALAGRRVMVTGGGGFLGRPSSSGCSRRGAGGDLRPAQPRLRPAPSRADRPGHRRRPPGRDHPPRGGRRRDRRQPREPGPLLLRERDHGHPAHRGGTRRRRREVRHDRHRLRLPQVHAGAVPRGRPLGRLSGGDERAVRPRQEDAARAGPGLPPAVRHERDLPDPGQPLRAGRQLRPGQLARHPGADQEVRRGARGGRRSDRGLGHGIGLARVPLRRRRRRGHRARRRAVRRRRAGEPRRRAGDHDPRPRRDDRAPDAVRGRDPLGRVEARRPAAACARHGRAREAFGFVAGRRSRTACGATIEWYERSRSASVPA